MSPRTAAAGGKEKIALSLGTQPLAKLLSFLDQPTKPRAHSQTSVNESVEVRPVKHSDGLPDISSRLKPLARSGGQILAFTPAMLLLASRRAVSDVSDEISEVSSVSLLKTNDLS